MGIDLQEVSYTYQKDTPFEGRALFGVDAEIKDGSYTAIIGHTGSGKSTLLQLLNALNVPTAGQVVFGDVVVDSQSKQKELKPIRKQVGLVFQFPESQLFDETVLKDVAFGPQNFEFLRKKRSGLPAKNSAWWELVKISLTAVPLNCQVDRCDGWRLRESWL